MTHRSISGVATDIAEVERIVADLQLPVEWDVRIEVRRRKTLGIAVRAGGTVTLAVPDNIAACDLSLLLETQVDRVARAVERHRRTVAVHPAKDIVDGEHFDYLGRTYRLRIVQGRALGVALVDDWLELAPGKEGEPDASQLIDWYASRGAEWIADAMPAMARATGMPTPVTTVRDLGNRWGLRGRDGSVALHWATFQLPLELVDLVLAHELTHLRVSKHSAEFWRELGKLVPDFAARQYRLAEVGATAWLGALRYARK